ncbi:MAG: hypothetical protein LAN62_01835 [Acidobacteriia bacterium]|nr:hypothetical protein [Terriglobia bacterium]
MNPVIPAPVPIPLPAPVWLIQLLMVFTFILHLIPMNLLVGGAVILAVSSYRGRNEARHRELARRAAHAMPPVVAFAITLGVAPLLFLQLLYGQLFYTSSVLMAWSWLAVVALLMLAYYGVYWFALQQEELGPRGFWVIALTALIVIYIMRTFVANLSLMQQPQVFYARFLTGRAGNYLGPAEALVFTRLAHFFLAALAIGGLGLAVLARSWKAEAPELAVWARRYGLRWFQAGTGLQFLVGLWFLFSLPAEMRGAFLGGDRLSTALLIVAVALALLALIAARKSLAVGSVAILGTVSLMAVIRHLVRIAYLRPYFDPRTLPVEGQWTVFVIFAVLLVAGILTVGWMLFHFFRPAARESTR